ncbi:MAG: hypothetical protein P1U86_11100 [Verrucomicrobiales bacterium]|nr:hypothetical protein [Verrucomicrobiales bacterium]
MNPKHFRLVLLLSGLALILTGCKTRNTQPMPQEPVPVPPAGYGEAPPANGDGGIPLPPEQQGGRFGYSGDNAGAPPAPPKPADPPKPGVRDVRDIDPADSSASAPAPPEKKPEPKKTPSSSDMPYANPVPGNPLAVTLPGANSSLGKISIEKYDSSMNPTGEPLKRGTQVQIPDPNNPGKKIFFKVP